MTTNLRRITAVTATIAVMGLCGAATAVAHDSGRGHGHHDTSTDVTGYRHRDYGARHSGHAAHSHAREHGNRKWYHYGESTPNSTPGLANPEF
jgi:hypothetical protein